MVLWIVLGGVGLLVLFLAVLEIAFLVMRKKNKNFDYKDYKLTDAIGKNPDGTKRQELLQGIQSKKGGYRRVGYELHQYRNKNTSEDALGVFVNGQQIGNLPKEAVPELIENWEQMEQVMNVKVHSGKGKSLGATVTIQFKKQKQSK